MSYRGIAEGYQARLNTTYSVAFPEFATVKYQPYEVTIHQEERSHDVAILKYQLMTNFFFDALKTGTAVSIDWVNNPKARGQFIGHVVKVKRIRAAQLEQGVEVHCIASSFPLKETKSNTWKNKTASEIVADIGKQTKLKTVITPHPARFTQISMYGQSYWEFLNELAFKIGYVLYVKNATIYFQDVDEVMDQQSGLIPLLNFEVEYAPPFHAPIERTLDTFEPTVSDFIEDDDQPRRSTKLLSAVDPVSAKVVSTTKTPQTTKALRKNQSPVIFNDNTSLDVSNSKMFADTLAQGKADRSRLTIPANFSGQGDPRITPYGVVEVSGVDETSDGFWLVRSVTHTLNKVGSYQCSGVLVTDGRGLNAQSSRRKEAGGVPVLNLTNRNNKAPITRPKKATLTKSTFTYSKSKSGFGANKQTWKAG